MAHPSPYAFLEAARAPTVLPQTFGLWTIERIEADWLLEDPAFAWVGWPTFTVLKRVTEATQHLDAGEVVMEDTLRELSRHLPIWLAAHGRVLVTGLGLGCVVRGLLASPLVEHVDVVEIDSGILRVVGSEFVGIERVSLHHGDALTIDLPGRWDFAWHDLWTDGEAHLQSLHIQLFIRWHRQCHRQGAWAFPRYLARLLPWRPLGAPRRRSHETRREAA